MKEEPKAQEEEPKAGPEEANEQPKPEIKTADAPRDLKSKQKQEIEEHLAV